MNNKVALALLDCRKCGLRRAFEKDNRQRSKYCAFGLYYTDEQARKSKFVFLTQNPGLASPRSTEYDDLKSPPKGGYVHVMQQQYANWLLRRSNRFFSEPFFKALKSQGLIEYVHFGKYMHRHFYRDFFVTDLVKCRAPTSTVKNKHVETCTENYLNEELDRYGRRKLVFAFSSRTWDYLMTPQFAVTLVSPRGKLKGSLDKVSNVHGLLFRSETLESWIIPLAHFSQRQFNNYLRDSYFSYLNDGLEEYLARRGQTNS